MGEIFRKKSLDRVNSPEDLNEYMRVTNPPVWFALIAVILLLCGAIVLSVSAKLETKAKAVVISSEEGIWCYISENNISDIKEGTIVRIDDTEYTVSKLEKQKLQADAILNDYEMKLADFTDGEAIYRVCLEGNAEYGSYKADVVIEEISPIAFLLGDA